MKIQKWRIYDTALLLGVSGLVLHFFCYRGPTSAEIKERYNVSPVTAVDVDGKQSDIGYFGITTHSATGSETFWIETSPQWTWPWQSYNWPDDAGGTLEKKSRLIRK